MLFRSVDRVLTGGWQHVAVSYDGETATVYVDGSSRVAVDIKTQRCGSGLALTSGGFAIGGGFDNPYDGSIDEVAVYSVALTPDQVLRDMTPQSPSFLTDGTQTCASVFLGSTPVPTIGTATYTSKSGVIQAANPRVFYYWAKVHFVPVGSRMRRLSRRPSAGCSPCRSSREARCSTARVLRCRERR